MPDHLPGFGTITQLVGNRNRRQIPQIGKTVDDFENAQYAFCEVAFKLDNLVRWPNATHLMIPHESFDLPVIQLTPAAA